MIKDLTEFKELYKEFYYNLPEKYTHEIWPFFVQIGENFNDVNKKCLFIGKSVNGWITNSRDVNALFDNNNKNRISNRDDEIKWVENLSGNHKGYNSRRSAFWRIIKNVTKDLFDKKEWYKYIAWSNLYKFSPRKGNPNTELQKMQKKHCIKILDKEIEYLKPNYIVFLTSSWEKFYLDHLGISKNIKEIIEWNNYKTFYQKNNGIIYIRSQHPQGKPEKDHIIETIWMGYFMDKFKI
jgi:hypothetical protein